MSVPRKFHKTVAFNAGTAVDVKDPGATRTAYVTKMTFSIVTHANGKLLSLRDNAGSPVTYAKHIDATAAAGVPSVVTYDFGESGIPMTAGKKVQVISESAGPTAYAYVEGYVL